MEGREKVAISIRSWWFGSDPSSSVQSERVISVVGDIDRARRGRGLVGMLSGRCGVRGALGKVYP